jgi:hypothetical protein
VEVIVTQEVFMPDKLGHIGSGKRVVIAEIGYKHVFLRPATFPNCRRQRIKRSTWDEIVLKTEAMKNRGTEPAKRVSR